MRVAILAPRAHPWHAFGGLERHVFDLCRFLRREGVEIDLWLSTPERSAEPFADDPGFRLRIVPGRAFVNRRFAVVVTRSTLYPLFSLRMGARVARAAREDGYAAILAVGLTGFGIVVAAPRVPVLLVPYGMEEILTPNPWKRTLYLPFRLAMRRAAAGARRVVALDDVLVNVTARALRVAPSKVVSIPSSISVEEALGAASAERAREALASAGAAGAEPLLVSVGRLAPNKGFPVGLDALARVREALPSRWRWVLVGEGPARPAIEERARTLGLTGHVCFAGAVGEEDKHSLLAAADLFLQPTLYEGSSLVTLEAMAHARPIVATGAGGIPDKIEEGVTGWLARPGDPASLAAGLRGWLATSPEERRRIGERAAARCRERFDWPVVVRRWVDLVRDVAVP